MNEEKIINLFVTFIIILFYVLGVYSLLQFIFWPKEALKAFDYIIEILGYVLIGTIIFVNKKRIVKALV